MVVRWFAALIACGIIQWLVLRKRPAAFQYRWHPVLSALPCLASIAFLAASPGPLTFTVLASFFVACIWVLGVLGVQFCENCGADVRNSLCRYQNWERCPKCQTSVSQTPPGAKSFFYLQFGSMATLLLLGSFAIASGSVLAVFAAAIVSLAPFGWASLKFRNVVQLSARLSAERAV